LSPKRSSWNSISGFEVAVLAPGEDAIAKGCDVGGCDAGGGVTSIRSSISIGADMGCYISLKIDVFGGMYLRMADAGASWSMMKVVGGCMAAGVPGVLGPIAGAGLALRRQSTLKLDGGEANLFYKPLSRDTKLVAMALLSPLSFTTSRLGAILVM
jgi:hypothetical protein